MGFIPRNSGNKDDKQGEYIVLKMTKKGNQCICSRGRMAEAEKQDKRRETMNLNENETEEMFTEEEMLAYTE